MFNLGSNFKESAAPIHARELAVAFASVSSARIERTPAPTVDRTLEM